MIESWFAQDLKKPVHPHEIRGNVFSADNQANLVGVKVFNDGVDAELSGTVSANIIRPDGGTVAVSGTLDGNKCSVVLPGAAYAIPGKIAIALKLTNDEVITTLLVVIATVYRTSTETAIDPGTIIPSIQDLLDAIDDAEEDLAEAIAEIPQDYSELQDDVADLKSALEPAATGSDVGKFLKAKTVSGGKVTEYEFGAASGGLTADIKSALLACFAKVAWIDDDGQDYYDALEEALNPPASLVSISAVYTQSGTVYTTDTLDSLKPDLVVTALYEDTSTETVTNYTLSGTLTEGTSTITVSYGGKTTTFTVTVSVWSTLPRIAATDSCWDSSGQPYSRSGFSRTELYEYDIDLTALKAHAYYDAENDYMKNNGSIFVVKYYLTNPDSAGGGYNKHVVYAGTTFVDSATPAAAQLKQMVDTRYKTEFMQNNKIKLGFSLYTAGIADSYAYFDTTVTGIMPEGVNAGDIIFAGANTPYYGKHNISEVTT